MVSSWFYDGLIVVIIRYKAWAVEMLTGCLIFYPIIEYSSGVSNKNNG